MTVNAGRNIHKSLFQTFLYNTQKKKSEINNFTAKYKYSRNNVKQYVNQCDTICESM